MIRTKAPAVRTWIRSTLTTLNPSVQVILGAAKDMQSTYIMVGHSKWLSANWKLTRTREEEFSVMVVFAVQVAGGAAETAEQTVLDLAASFENALANDPQLGGICVNTNFVPKSLTLWPIPGGFEGQLETEVIATCRPTRP